MSVSGRARDSKKCCPSFSVKDKMMAVFCGSEKLSSSKESEKRVSHFEKSHKPLHHLWFLGDLFQPMRPVYNAHIASLCF